MKFNLIVAVCRNNGIGYNGSIPWHIKKDLYYFSKLTKGDGTNAVVMGNNTWKNLRLPGCIGLPGRDNFVFSSTNRFDILFDNDRLIKSFMSYDDFIKYIQLNPIYKEIWIIGGEQVYKTFLSNDKIDKCYITTIDKEFECDTFFPALDVSIWKETKRTQDYDDFYKCNIDYCVYEKV
jgi:dihydrofolate reductase